MFVKGALLSDTHLILMRARLRYIRWTGPWRGPRGQQFGPAQSGRQCQGDGIDDDYHDTGLSQESSTDSTRRVLVLHLQLL
jgi:hypothetical protein